MYRLNEEQQQIVELAAHGLDRLFRGARAPIVMAPTSDQAYDFIGRALCGMEVF